VDSHQEKSTFRKCYVMTNVLAKAINGLSPAQAEAIIRENASLKESLTAVLKDAVEIFNLLSELVKDEKILYGRRLAELSTRANDAIQAEPDQGQKILLCHAFTRQQITHIKKALKTRAPAAGTEEQPRPQPITRIMLRAQAIAAHIQVLAKDAKSKIAFTSRDARTYLAGLEGKTPSRRDTIRAFHRAAKLCPAIDLESVPGDGRETKRLILDAKNLAVPEIEENAGRTMWQRSRACDVLPWLASG
jgi:hypothetical protein